MNAGPVASFRFGRFVLNLERGCLQHDGIDVELRPKAFAMLRYLVEHSGRLAAKDELIDATWPNTAVSDDSLSQCILEVRKALGDHDHRLIKTVPRRGYVFTAEVRATPVQLGGSEPDNGQTAATASGRGGSALPGMSLAALGAVAAGIVALSILSPNTASAPLAIKPILSASETAVGQPISAYPAGVPVISAAVVPLAPGASSGWHTHPVPLFAYVLSGTVRVDYGTKGTREYQAGDALIEALDWPHNAHNPGTVPASILVVYVGKEGVANSVAVAHAD